MLTIPSFIVGEVALLAVFNVIIIVVGFGVYIVGLIFGEMVGIICWN